MMGKKEIAYVALAGAIIGLLLIIAGTMYESSFRGYNCDSGDWVIEKYGDGTGKEFDQCDADQANAYDASQVLPSIGHGIMLFSIKENINF